MMYRVLFTALVCLFTLTGEAKGFCEHPYVLLTVERIMSETKSSAYNYQIIFMQNKWFGIGVGIGFSEAPEEKDGNVPQGLYPLVNEMDDYYMTFDISALISHKISDIAGHDVRFEVMPTLRLQPRDELQYAYVRNDGVPRLGIYKNSAFCGNILVGAAVNIYKKMYVRIGYLGTNCISGKLRVSYDSEGIPKIRSGVTHSMYISVGFKL